MVANHETGEIVQTEVNETGRYERMLTVRLEEAELETAKSKAARKLSREMKIKGFRPGKAPRAIVERMVGADHLRSEAVDEAIPEAVQEALEETDLEPATVPRVSDVRDGDDGGLEVDVVVTLWPVVDAVPDFDGREVEVEAPVLTEEEIEGQIDALRNQFAGLGDVERDAGVGDFVVVDITISAEGEEIEDTAANDLLYEIGSESFIAGLDEILVGLGSGGSAEGPATLPAGFTDRGGEEVTLHVSVKEVKEKELPELTDEFVSDVTDFETVEELRQRLELNMRALRVHNARAAFEERLIEQLIADLDLDRPGDLVDAEVEARVRNLGKRRSRIRSSSPTISRSRGRTGPASSPKCARRPCRRSRRGSSSRPSSRSKVSRWRMRSTVRRSSRTRRRRTPLRKRSRRCSRRVVKKWH